jgi:hypothetical protein
MSAISSLGSSSLYQIATTAASSGAAKTSSAEQAVLAALSPNDPDGDGDTDGKGLDVKA